MLFQVMFQLEVVWFFLKPMRIPNHLTALNRSWHILPPTSKLTNQPPGLSGRQLSKPWGLALPTETGKNLACTSRVQHFLKAQMKKLTSSKPFMFCFRHKWKKIDILPSTKKPLHTAACRSKCATKSLELCDPLEPSTEATLGSPSTNLKMGHRCLGTSLLQKVWTKMLELFCWGLKDHLKKYQYHNQFNLELCFFIMFLSIQRSTASPWDPTALARQHWARRRRSWPWHRGPWDGTEKFVGWSIA